MKRFLFVCGIVAFSLLLLSACKGSDKTATSENMALNTIKNFSIQIPEDWRRINKEDFANTIPEETVVIFLKNIEGQDFIPNANVVKESLNADVTSLEYAKANILLGSKAIVDYRLISNAEENINGIKTVMHVFRARTVTTEPLIQYRQTYFVQNRVGYTVTCVSKDDDSVMQSMCGQIVKSFRFQS